MKRFLTVLCVLLAAVLLTSCAAEPLFGTADDEIFTYNRIDGEKTQLVVAKIGNINVSEMIRAFTAAYPDIQVTELDLTGGNGNYAPARDWICSTDPEDVPDVTISAGEGYDYAVEEYEDLSGYELLKYYTAESLENAKYDGHIYFLPGPSKITAMAYNKTMFEKYGWQVPTTFDELVELCVQIKADTNGAVEAWNTNAKYGREFVNAFQAIFYEQIFKGMDNQRWLADYKACNAKFTGHMEPMFEAFKKLADAGVLSADSFTYSATTRGKEFLAGNIAMINHATDGVGKADAFEVGVFPFPSSVGGDCYVISAQNFAVGVPIKEHTDEQKKAINSFLEFISLPENQDYFSAGGIMISSVINAEPPSNKLVASLYETHMKGNSIAADEMEVTDRDYSALSDIRAAALAITNGEATPAQAIAAIDASLEQVYLNGRTAAVPEVIATIEQDLTILQTSELFCDMFIDKTDAQIALMPNNAVFRGNVVKLFAGDYTTGMSVPLKPRSYANDATLVKANMTGAQLIAAMNEPPDFDEGTCNCVYAFSGLKATVAPWSELGTKYISLTLADGSAIDENKEYTVAFWAGSVKDKFYTEFESYEGTFDSMLSDYFKKLGEIKAPDDGRMTLVWS